MRLHLHQGTSEQIAEMMNADNIDFAIATGSYNLFPGLVKIPATAGTARSSCRATIR